jgi:sirohydrochlorin ferrochelatase
MFLGTIADNNADKKAKGRAVAPRGSEQGRSKLTESDIPHLLSRLARGERQVDVGRHFGVSQAVVSAIKRGALWKHV